MANSLKKFFQASFAVSLFSILIAFLAQPILPPQIPLFYGLPESESQLSPALGLALPGVFSLLILVGNLALVKIVKDDFLKKILAGASLVASIFASITTVKIVFLVGKI